MAYYEQRQRAESFGQVAQNYDAFRPQYPEALVREILDSSTSNGPRVLDVGSGTGILAAQLREAGCEVLAVEPDSEMAGIAKGKGLVVEKSTFEDWDPAGRTFDIIAFGQSFHWVDPAIALPQIAQALNPRGALALAWNDIQASGETGSALALIMNRFSPPPAPSSERSNEEHPVLSELKTNGFDAEELTFEESLAYSRDTWLSMVFTHSAQLTMEPAERDQMFAEMAAVIPDSGLSAHNEAQLILASPSS